MAYNSTGQAENHALLLVKTHPLSSLQHGYATTTLQVRFSNWLQCRPWPGNQSNAPGPRVDVVGMSRRPECPTLGGQYHPWPCDLSENSELPEQPDAVFDKFPQIDLVINNAGFGILSRLEDLGSKPFKNSTR